jgi:ribonuclease D
MSNWERRPLRKTQQHYAALDAYILVDLIHKMAAEGKEMGQPIENHIHTLDNSDFVSSKVDDDDEEIK